MDVKANFVGLATEKLINDPIPEHFKERAWDRVVDDEGNITYTQITWMELIVQNRYKYLYGATPLFKNATWKGVDVGDRYLMSGKLFVELGDYEALEKAGFDLLLTMEEGQEFINENTPKV